MALPCRTLMMAAAILLAAEPAMACSLSITDVTSTRWSGSRGQGYDVFSQERVAQAVTFRVQNREGGCAFFATVVPVSFTGSGAGFLRGGPQPLIYQVFKDASGDQRLMPRDLATENEVFISASRAGEGHMPFQFALVVPPQQVVSPGLYQDELEIRVYEGGLATGTLRDMRRIPVVVPVPAVAELSFSQGGAFDPGLGSYTVNFHKLQRASRRSIILRARANSGYRVLFRSVNGALRHVDPGDDSLVPYTMMVDGAVTPLQPGASREGITNPMSTDIGGRQHNIEFVVGEIGDASAGDYRDTISLTVIGLH